MPLLSLCLYQARHSDQSLSYKHSARIPLPLLMTSDPSGMGLSLLLSSETTVSAPLDSSPLITALSVVVTHTQWLLKPDSRTSVHLILTSRGWIIPQPGTLWIIEDCLEWICKICGKVLFFSVVLSCDLWHCCGLAKGSCRGDPVLAGLWNPFHYFSVFNNFPTHFLTFLLLCSATVVISTLFWL